MDKTLSKDQLKEIMNSAPAGVDKTKLFRKYVDSGYQIEGYNTPTEPGLGSKLVDRAKNIGKEVATFGTLGMNTLDPNTPKDQQDLAVVGGLAQAGAAPARALIQAGGAVGDVVGAGLEATGLDKVISKVVSPVVKPVVQSEAFKKASDAFSMLPEETQTLLKGLPEVANLFGVSPAASIVKKGVTNAVTSTGEAIAKRSAQTAIKDASKIDNLAGTIVQGKADDILKAKKSLTDIDITGIKTYKDLVSTLDDKITSLSTGLDDVLSTKPTPKALDDLNLNVKVGDQSVTHNYVKDAVSQLDDLYTKTNNIEGKTKIAQLLQKAEAEGLTIKEVNDLARLHGKELNAFNANGQAASGLTKQAAENTRVGLKSTARDLFDDPVYKQTDTEISNLIRTRDLVDGVSEKVNQLKQRIQERSLGAKVGVALGRAINLLSLGSAKGIVEALIPRGQGFKVMNALDLEEALGANLKKLQKALEGKSEAEIIKNLESIQASKVNLATSKNAINNTNSNIQSQSTPTTPNSKGIRGMINFDEIISSVIPTKKILTEAKDAVEKLESTVSFVKSAKSPNAITDSRKELQTLMNKMGVETVVTGSNVNNVLEEAENMVSQLKAHIKKSESQSASSVMNREFDTKKKVVSSPTGEYLYHGTNEDVLDSITKNGLKPMSRGQLSLSKTEDYANTFAREGITPRGKTNSVMLRVKSDFLNDKTTIKRADGKTRPAQDQINELLTKETVPPEAIEIYKNGKWESLVKSSTLEQEAKKYKSADEFVKAQGEILYHGSPVGIIDKIDKTKLKPNGELGSGFYLSEDSKIASYYAKESGKVNEINIGTLRLLNTSKSGVDGFVDNVIKYGRENYIQKLKDEGYDGIRAMDKKEVVIFPESVDKLKTKSELTNIWHKVNKK